MSTNHKLAAAGFEKEGLKQRAFYRFLYRMSSYEVTVKELD